MGRVFVEWVACVVCLVANEDDLEACALSEDLVLANRVVNDPFKHDVLLY